jgi:hypothetical protein
VIPLATENPRVGGSIPPLATILNQTARSNPTNVRRSKFSPGAHLVPTSTQRQSILIHVECLLFSKADVQIMEKWGN